MPPKQATLALPLKQWLNNVLFTLLLFLYIYGPDLKWLPVNFVIIWGCVSLLALCKYYRTLVRMIKVHRYFLVLFLVATLYGLTLTSFSSDSLSSNSYSVLDLRILFEVYLGSLIIACLLNGRKYDLEHLFKLI